MKELREFNMSLLLRLSLYYLTIKPARVGIIVLMEIEANHPLLHNSLLSIFKELKKQQKSIYIYKPFNKE
jgi:hypothetical protein